MYKIYDLKCNEMESPRGLSDPQPVFSWKLHSDRQNTFQTGYRICVAYHNQVIWDTKLVNSDATFEIVYEGELLKTGQYYSWFVESVNNYGESAKSSENLFLTGVLDPGFWQAGWVETGAPRKCSQDSTDAGAMFAGKMKPAEHPEEFLNPAVYLRREFLVEKPVRQALIYATARGIYELQLDGHPISNLLAPEYTSYASHLEYQTYDVTALLQADNQTGNPRCSHAIGCILADGWFTGKIGLMGIGNQYGETNAFLMQMEIVYEDDTRAYMVSDEEMRWSYGAYLYADLFVGEYYDASKEHEGFSMAGYDDTGWNRVCLRNYGYGNLKGQSIKPITVIKTITPRLLKTPNHEWVLDAGENIVGYTSFCVEGKPGQEIRLIHSEVLDRSGNFLQNIMGQNKNQEDCFICGKEGKNSYCPKFTFHGFRYVKVSGLEAVDAEDFTITVIASRLQQTGSFATSNEKLNRLQANIYRSQQGNMLAIPTDCPQRERAGWTGDMQVYTPTAVFNMDVNAFLRRWLYDMRLEQLPDGQIPNVIPTIDSNKYIDRQKSARVSSAGWGDACIIVPYRLYQAYGDVRILEENYEMMCKWMDYVEAEAGDTCLWDQGFHFGDWLIPSIMRETGDPMQTAIATKEETATAMYAYTTNMMIEICNVLGNIGAAEHFMRLNTKIRKAFSDTYIRPDGSMKQPFQGLYVLALHMDLVEASKRKGCIEKLVELIHEAGDCLDTGFLSIPFLLETLYECGEQDLAYKLLYQENPPSWLYALKHDATTVWENWLAVRPDGTPTNSSYNHFSFGCVGDFMYRHIGGLQVEEVGYKKIRIAPDAACGLDWAQTEYNSRYGNIRIYWEKKDGGLELQFKLPPNTSAVVTYQGKQQETGNGSYQLTLLN